MPLFPRLPRSTAPFAIALACAAAEPAAQADELADLINIYRAAPRTCEGSTAAPAAALVAEPVLAQLRVGVATFLESALQDAGYRVDRAEAIVVKGAANAQAAMDAIRQSYCRQLLAPTYAAIGTARRGNEWQVILAHPLVIPVLPAMPDAGQQILALVNAARAQPRSCGGAAFGPARPLAWNPRLAQAALGHSDDMAEKHYFDHRQPDGTAPADRAAAAGYRWRRVGENIASGQRSVEEAVTAWLASPGHCANIMNPGFTEMGAAYAINPHNQNRTAYWTQVFAAPR